ncbi:MAG: hypothetical protein ACFFC7_32205 [Candidatus Hermodarchaeota archaeon]
MSRSTRIPRGGHIPKGHRTSKTKKFNQNRRNNRRQQPYQSRGVNRIGKKRILIRRKDGVMQHYWVNSAPNFMSPSRRGTELIYIKGEYRAIKRGKAGRIKSNKSGRKHLQGLKNYEDKQEKEHLKSIGDTTAEITIPGYSKIKRTQQGLKNLRKIINPDNNNDRVEGIKNIGVDTIKNELYDEVPELGRIRKLSKLAKSTHDVYRSHTRKKKTTKLLERIGK